MYNSISNYYLQLLSLCPNVLLCLNLSVFVSLTPVSSLESVWVRPSVLINSSCHGQENVEESVLLSLDVFDTTTCTLRLIDSWLIHSFIHSFHRYVIHTYIHSPMNSTINSSIHPSIHQFIHSHIHQYTGLSIHPFILPAVIPPSGFSFANNRYLIHLFICSFIFSEHLCSIFFIALFSVVQCNHTFMYPSHEQTDQWCSGAHTAILPMRRVTVTNMNL